MLIIDSAPIKHDFTVLLNDDSCDLAHNQQLQHVDCHRKNEQEFHLLASFLRLKVQPVLVRSKHHRCKHLQYRTLQVAEPFELVAPSIGDHIGKHYCKGPPKAAKKQNQRSNIRNHIESALDVCQELEEWNQEADQQDQVHSLHVEQHLVLVDQLREVNHTVLLLKDLRRRSLHRNEGAFNDKENQTSQVEQRAHHGFQRALRLARVVDRLDNVEHGNCDEEQDANDVEIHVCLFLRGLVDVSPELLEALAEDDLVGDAVLEKQVDVDPVVEGV